MYINLTIRGQRKSFRVLSAAVCRTDVELAGEHSRAFIIRGARNFSQEVVESEKQMKET